MSTSKFSTYRYIRPITTSISYDEDGVPNDYLVTAYNMSGITFRIEVDHNIGAISWSESICNFEDNFCKEDGRKFADERWKDDKITATKYDPNLTLTDNILKYYESDETRITSRERTIIQHLATYDTLNFVVLGLE